MIHQKEGRPRVHKEEDVADGDHCAESDRSRRARLAGSVPAHRRPGPGQEELLACVRLDQPRQLRDLLAGRATLTLAGARERLADETRLPVPLTGCNSHQLNSDACQLRLAVTSDAVLARAA